MVNNHIVVARVRRLEQRANELRSKIGSQPTIATDATLWMSSLDIIGELLNVVQDMIGAQDVGASKGAVTNSIVQTQSAFDYEKMELACPDCHAVVDVAFDAIADAATACPVCGANILLSNPT